MRVYFIRHGATRANTECILQGADTPLSALGRKQIEESAREVLVHLNAECILTSDMRRARESAEIIARIINLPITTSSLLAELRRPSELHGRWQYGLESILALLRIFLHAGNKDWHYSDEENPYEFYLRARAALTFIEQQQEKRLIVVTHRGTLTMLLALMRAPRKMPNLRTFLLTAYLEPIHNAGITVCDFENGKWHVEQFDESKHLDNQTS